MPSRFEPGHMSITASHRTMASQPNTPCGMNYRPDNWSGNPEKRWNTALKGGIWGEEKSDELEYGRSRQARGERLGICHRLLWEPPLFVGSLMAPLNRFCSKLQANWDDLCSSLLLVVINEKFLGFEQEKKVVSLTVDTRAAVGLGWPL